MLFLNENLIFHHWLLTHSLFPSIISVNMVFNEIVVIYCLVNKVYFNWLFNKQYCVPNKNIKNSGRLCRSRKRSTIWAKPTYTCVSDGCGWGMLIAYLIVTDRAVSRFSHSVRGSKPEWTCDCFSMLSIVKESYVSTQKWPSFIVIYQFWNAISWFPIKISCMIQWKTVGMSLGQFHCSLLLCDNQNCLYWRQQRFCEYLTLSFSLCGGK